MVSTSVWFPAYIGIGSNLDDPVSQVQSAVDALARLADTRLMACSGLYRNPPMGAIEQPDYINAVAAVITRTGAHDFLRALHRLEMAQGRDRRNEQRWGPRRLDLDLLVYGSRRVDEEALQIPHPGISGRNFVLFPLLELAPQLTIPGQGCVRMLAASVDRSSLEMIGG